MQGVRENFPEIVALRKRGFSWSEISEVLARMGVMSRDDRPISMVALRSAFFLVGLEQGQHSRPPTAPYVDPSFAVDEPAAVAVLPAPETITVPDAPPAQSVNPRPDADPESSLPASVAVATASVVDAPIAAEPPLPFPEPPNGDARSGTAMEDEAIEPASEVASPATADWLASATVPVESVPAPPRPAALVVDVPEPTIHHEAEAARNAVTDWFRRLGEPQAREPQAAASPAMLSPPVAQSVAPPHLHPLTEQSADWTRPVQAIVDSAAPLPALSASVSPPVPPPLPKVMTARPDPAASEVPSLSPPTIAAPVSLSSRTVGAVSAVPLAAPPPRSRLSPDDALKWNWTLRRDDSKNLS